MSEDIIIDLSLNKDILYIKPVTSNSNTFRALKILGAIDNNKEYYLTLRDLPIIEKTIFNINYFPSKEYIHQSYNKYNNKVIIKPARFKNCIYIDKNKSFNFDKNYIDESSILNNPGTLNEYLKLLYSTGSDIKIHKDINEIIKNHNLINDGEIDTNTKLPALSFQHSAIKFALYYKKVILALQMGLGKTFIALSVFNILKKQMKNGEQNKCLVLCRNSTDRLHWQRSVEKFTDLSSIMIIAEKVKCNSNKFEYGFCKKILANGERCSHSATDSSGYCAIHGGFSERQKERFKLYDKKADITIVTYKTATMDIEKIKSMNYYCVIIDEASFLRNFNTQQSKAIRKIKSEYILLLTGTPIENKPLDIYGQINLLDNKLLGNYFAFRDRYCITRQNKNGFKFVVGYKNLFELKNRVKHRIFRLKKSEISDKLPSISIIKHTIPCDPITQKLYDNIGFSIKESMSQIQTEKNIKKKNKLQSTILTSQNLLRQATLDLNLLERYGNDLFQYGITKTDIKNYKNEKLNTLINAIEESYESEKILLFCFYTKMLDIIGETLKKRIPDCKFIKYAGDLTDKVCDKNLDKFKSDDKIRVMLASDKAQKGLNIQEASIVMNYDLIWNPASIAQRNERIHRIDSVHNNVQIMFFLTEDTIEERMANMLINKQEFSDVVIEPDSSEMIISNKMISGLI